MKNLQIRGKNYFLKEHWVKLALIVLILAFASVKLQTLNMSYINRDEPLYSWQSLAIYHNPELVFSEEVNRPYPAVIPLLSAPLNALFELPIPMRLIVFLFSFVALVFTYLVGKEMFSKKAGIVAAILLALSPIFFYFSTKAMPDVPLVALGTIAIYLLITLNKRKAILLPFVVLIMYLIKPASFVVFPPIVIFLLAKYRKQLQTKQIAVILLAAAILVTGVFFIAEHNAPNELVRTSFAPGWNYFKFALLILEMVSWRVAGIPMVLFSLFSAIKLRKEMTANAGLLILWVFLTAFPFFLAKIWVARYYLLLVPALAIIAGEGLAYLIEKKKYALLGATVLSVIVLIFISANYSNVIYKTDFDWKYTNETLQELEAWIGANVSEDSKLIIVSDPYIMRTIRLSAENSLKNPRKQMVVNPTKGEFEAIVEETGEHYLILEDATPTGRSMIPVSETWLYAQEVDWQDYLKEQGFEKIKEIPPKNSYFIEAYSVYKKSNS